MRQFLTIWRREFTSCFLSPVAYITMIAFLLLSGVTFVSAVISNVGSDEDPAALLFSGIVLWMTFLITVVSMRLFAEENRAGTFETLITSPVTETEIVLGKYAGGISFVWIVIAPTLSYLYILSAMNPAMRGVDPGHLVGGVLIVALLSAFCLALGLLVSMLTRNQIIAAICCFCAVWFVLLFGWLVSALPVEFSVATDSFDAITHLEEYTRGVLDLRPLVLYLTGTFFVLFTAIRVLAWRHWR